jgi:putative DNA primase/helicase
MKLYTGSAPGATGSSENARTDDPGPRPVAPIPNIDAVPAELRALPQWVCWRYELNKDRTKWTKIPRRETCYASHSDPATWTTFDEAVAAYRRRAERTGSARLDGIGFVFSADDPYVGVDLDYCLDDHGEGFEWAKLFFDRLFTYGEISPSGCGIKFVARGKLPGDGHKRNGFGNGSGAIEMYDRLRFFTITGRRLPELPETVVDLADTIVEIHNEVWPPAPAPAPAPTPRPESAPSPAAAPLPGDDDLIELARRFNPAFSPLFDRGDTSANHGDDSAADFALCSLLAFWFNRDATAIDRVFRRSALMRAKWDEPRGATTYGAMTIDNAIDKTDRVYEPSAKDQDQAEATDPAPRPPADGDGHPAEAEAPAEAPQAVGPAPVAVVPAPRFPLTDMGNGERLVHHHGQDLRYAHPLSKWLVWDGKRWALDNTAAAVRLAKRAARAIYREASDLVDDDDRKRTAAWGRTTEGRERLAAMMWCAQSEVAVLPEDLDQHPWLLNCPNGTVDLKTGELREHRREDLITRLCPVEYHPEAECPLWLKTLARIFAGNQVLIGFWRRLMGLCLTGSVQEQILPIPHGAGANGKSTLLGVMLRLLGPDYAMKAPPDLLMARRTPEHATERAALCGMRLVVAIETGQDARLNEVMIKELTGGDQITARRMREDFWSFWPTHKVFLCTNHRPTVRGTDHAIWRRLKLIPFNVTIPDDEQDRTLPDKLADELPGILAWCVRGCLEWQEEGLKPPAEVEAATTQYRKDEDLLGTFLDENSVIGDALRVKSSELFGRYKAWSGDERTTQRKFGVAMTERGFPRIENHGIWYQGLELRQDDPIWGMNVS